MMKADYVIIGAGISGCSIAYNLALKNQKNIIVIDKGYLTGGATGRCGAGIRQQWGTKMNCLLAKASIEFFEHAKERLGYEGDPEFKQKGYLILAVNKEEDKDFTKNVKLQNALGIPSVKLNKEEAKKIVPHLNLDSFISATYCETDGHLNPFTITDAYYQAAKRMGVKFYFHEEVLDIIVNDGIIEKVITDKKEIFTNNVINAAGGHANVIAEKVGINAFVYPERHEILVTEPIEDMQGPMVMSFGKNIYCQQVPHGSFLIGRTTPNEPPGINIESSWQFLDEMSKTVCEILPLIGKLRVIRQWAGLYTVSPDRQPIISKTDLKGFYLACGFSGHGFMFAPMTGLLLSEIILGEKLTIDIRELSIERFKKQNTFVYEKSVV
ncbi:MAG TPA: FAD-binding oxidoreductase [Acholeplasmataceae bacterium]|nr:FAD-binding oxidoreductase [Acholeplasmataceae bacterium]